MEINKADLCLTLPISPGRPVDLHHLGPPPLPRGGVSHVEGACCGPLTTETATHVQNMIIL